MKRKLLLCALLSALASACATTSGKETLEEKSGFIYLESGTRSLIEGKYVDALGSLQLATKYLPKNQNAWTNLGIAYMAREDYEHAEQAFKQALLIDPNNGDARSNLGTLYVKLERYEEAEKCFKEVIKNLGYANIQQAHFNLASLYIIQKKPLQAEQQLNLAVKANPSYCEAWFRLGTLQRDKGELAQAAKSLSRSVSGVCFNNPKAHYEIGSLFIKAREIPQAKAKLLEVIQFFPESEWAKKAEVTLNLIRD